MKKKIIKTEIEFEQKFPRTLKQKFEAYRLAAAIYIHQLRNPNQQLAFSVKGYEVTPTGKKPNALSAPELLAIVSTAAKLGKYVRVSTSGVEDDGQLNFYFTDQPADRPDELRGY
jgi:hypothetical protein